MSTTGTARVTSAAALQDAAVEISRILRDAKVDAPLRPRAMAAILVAAGRDGLSLDGINRQVAAALASSGLSCERRTSLTAALRLAGPDFERLTPHLQRIEAVLERVDLRNGWRQDFDVLGVFYEAFLRYGYDNNALGIVFTPRHIARFCVDLIGVNKQDRVIDLACGSGGLLVAAQDAMRDPDASGTDNHGEVIAGFDTNPTVWALAVLNMLFRGNAKADIHLGSCFDEKSRKIVQRQFTRALLNPPFSQAAEPEREFIDASMEALERGGLCAVVVKAGIFADDEHRDWRRQFLQRHTLLGVISLPEDVFYPAAVPGSILLARAHAPQSDDAPVLMAHVWNDGFEKLKNKRVERPGSDLPEVMRCFHCVLNGHEFSSPLAMSIRGEHLLSGGEWSPQEWLPQPTTGAEELRRAQSEVMLEILRAVAHIPELAEVALADFTRKWQELPSLSLGVEGPVRDFFHVTNGLSAGEKHYLDGPLPYISSGDGTNSIVRLVEGDRLETFPDGAITVTAFGQATVQPWPFLARGNGGSAVRVLVPRYQMGVPELAWFTAQINAQRWRFFYARMAIKTRIERLVVSSPPARLRQQGKPLATRINELRDKLLELSAL